MTPRRISSTTTRLPNDAPTIFAPPQVNLARVRVRDDSGRTMFDVYEPRYFMEENEPSRTPEAPSKTPPETSGLVALLERRPVAIIGALFIVVLLLSATVSALAIALARG